MNEAPPEVTIPKSELNRADWHGRRTALVAEFAERLADIAVEDRDYYLGYPYQFSKPHAWSEAMANMKIVTDQVLQDAASLASAKLSTRAARGLD